MPQLQINQGPQDALLYDNQRSYFTNVGYVRTSNFQVEYRNVDAQNTPTWGGTAQYIIPKAADLLGPVDLRVKINDASLSASGMGGSAAGSTRMWTQWNPHHAAPYAEIFRFEDDHDEASGPSLRRHGCDRADSDSP